MVARSAGRHERVAAGDGVIPARLWASACGMKSCSETTPATTGASAAGMLRVAHVGEMALSVDLQIVNLRVKRLAHLARRSREVDQHAVRMDLLTVKPCDPSQRRRIPRS